MKAPRLDNAVDLHFRWRGGRQRRRRTAGSGYRRRRTCVDRIGGDCKLVTGGGEIRVGQSAARCAAAPARARSTSRTVRGEAVLETNGGDIIAAKEAAVRCAPKPAAAASTSSRPAVPVTADYAAAARSSSIAPAASSRAQYGRPGAGAARPGVQCESGSGGIRVSNIAGPMRVSTSLGNIMASLLGGKLADSYLATGNGDITVLIPSNVGVTIQSAERHGGYTAANRVDFPAFSRRQGRASSRKAR